MKTKNTMVYGVGDHVLVWDCHEYVPSSSFKGILSNPHPLIIQYPTTIKCKKKLDIFAPDKLTVLI